MSSKYRMSTNQDTILDLTNEVPGLECLLTNMQRDLICKTEINWARKPSDGVTCFCFSNVRKIILKQWGYLADWGTPWEKEALNVLSMSYNP
jgi:hypothetical protein